MAKTRSQTGNITIKKEEEEDSKDNLLLNGVTTATRNKITKSKPSKRNNRHLPAQQVKVEEEETDTKSLLQPSPKHSPLPKGQQVSQQQINQLIDAIVNDNMSINKAASKVKISYITGVHYYNQYKNDPDKKIPSPRNKLGCPRRFYTQEHIENLIKHIVYDKISVSEASAKVNMNDQSGRHYYKKYLKDPDHNISIPRLRQYYTQDQKNEFIGYIINDKMNIKEASLKAKMNIGAGREYYHKYFKDQNPVIPTPTHITTVKPYTQEQIKEVIGCIINSKMSINAASKKANINSHTAGKYYRQYLKDNNMELPVQRRYTQDEINKFIGYIVDDNMNIKAASKKVYISYSCGLEYYKKYRRKHNLDSPNRRYSQDQVNELIGYIVGDKMTIKAASEKANMNASSGHRYYRKYLMNQDA